MKTATATPAAELTTEELIDELYDGISGTPIVLMGGANVVMQLARLPVGHGVAKSKFEAGRLDKHPIKRTRTTLAYLAIAMFGTEAERAAYRREVNRSHKAVHSSEGDAVEYNAFDPELQLWVAACIYIGAEDSVRLFDPGALEDAEGMARFYEHGARFGTTLQVTEDMWPADRGAFEAYWRDGIEAIEMDDVSRGYLQDFLMLGFLPKPMSMAFGPLHRFVATGFLPERFREEMHLPWGPRRQRAHDLYTKVNVAISKAMPGPIRRFPLNFYLWETRKRIRAGRAIV